MSQPLVQLLAEVVLQRRVDGAVPALDWWDVLRDDAVLDEVRLPVGPVVREGVPEL